MRTPWKFVADLVSRNPKAESHDDTPAVAADAIALEDKPGAEGPRPVGEATVAARSVEPMEAQAEEAFPAMDADKEAALIFDDTKGRASGDPIGVAEPEELPTLSRPKGASPAPIEPAPQVAGASETSVQPSPTRRKKNGADAKPSVSAGGSDEDAPAIATGPKSFLDEMAELDADVAELRRQLAKKLAEQNAQLRKMLARFGAR